MSRTGHFQMSGGKVFGLQRGLDRRDDGRADRAQTGGSDVRHEHRKQGAGVAHQQAFAPVDPDQVGIPVLYDSYVRAIKWARRGRRQKARTTAHTAVNAVLAARPTVAADVIRSDADPETHCGTDDYVTVTKVSKGS
jgi:hypothetical protein